MEIRASENSSLLLTSIAVQGYSQVKMEMCTLIHLGIRLLTVLNISDSEHGTVWVLSG